MWGVGSYSSLICAKRPSVTDVGVAILGAAMAMFGDVVAIVGGWHHQPWQLPSQCSVSPTLTSFADWAAAFIHAIPSRKHVVASHGQSDQADELEEEEDGMMDGGGEGTIDSGNDDENHSDAGGEEG